MKATNLTSTFRKTGIVLFTVIVLLVGTAAAQKTDYSAEHSQLTELAITNLKAGLQSDNFGVKRDCIYYAAVYDIKEAVETLTEELKTEKNPSLRVLISLALCKLSDSNGITANNDVLMDWNKKVDNLSNAIVEETKEQKSDVASSR